MRPFDQVGPPRQPPVERLAEREVYRNPFVSVWDDDVRFPDGRTGRHVRVVESAGRPGVAALVTRSGNIAIVRTFRYATQRWEWGIPRGFADEDDPAVSVVRELNEELGAPPASIELIGRITPNSGLLTSTVDCFHATWGEEPLAPADPEVESALWITMSALDEAVAAGLITDAFTLAALALARARGVLG